MPYIMIPRQSRLYEIYTSMGWSTWFVSDGLAYLTFGKCY